MNNKFNFDKFFENNKDLFDRLEAFDNLEYDVSQYILQHKEGLKDQLDAQLKNKVDLHPETLYPIYRDQYEDEAYRVVLDILSNVFNLDPENRLRITKKLIQKVAPELLKFSEDK